MSLRRAERAAPVSNVQALLDRAAVVAVDLVKVYGEGEAADRRLRGRRL